MIDYPLRLDKLLCHTGEMSRADAQRAIRNGWVQVNGVDAKKGDMKIQRDDIVLLDDEPIQLSGPRYLMLHKPSGYVCANKDGLNPIVHDLLGDLLKKTELQIVGRLDMDTTGLVLLTDDGQWNHRATSPKKNQWKIYRVQLAVPLSEQAERQLQSGVILDGEDKPTLPARVERTDDPLTILLHIQEGRYHQVKRMLAAVGNSVAQLHRLQIGAISLDEALGSGQWRYLSAEEIASV